MSLWDALTGKILHFNSTKAQANHQVCTVLKTFVSSRLPEYPNGEEIFVRARNALYAFYLGTTTVLSHNLEDCLAKYKQALFALNVHDYLCLISALHMGHVVGMYLHERDLPAARSWYPLLFEGIGDIYRRPDNYMVEWIDALDRIAEDVAMRLSYRVYDEIAPILSLPPDDPIECLTWSQIGVQCVRCMRGLFDQPEWNKVVEAELAEH